VLGVREQGIVCGFVEPADLTGWYCRDHLRPFGPEDVVDDDLDFTRLIPLLGQRPRLFVRSLSQVDGIVTRTDLQRPPVRMWLFGIITIIEMSLHRMIERRYPGDGWTDLVSAERLAKATDLLAERRRRNRDLGLLHCLQFSDKGMLVLKDDQLRAQVGFTSKRQGERVIKDLEALRNSLAHSQDIISCDLETIVRLAEHIEQILSL
jgi:hypothetical protein